MLLADWIEMVKKLQLQLTEGAITEVEFYNAVLFYAMQCVLSPEPTTEE